MLKRIIFLALGVAALSAPIKVAAQQPIQWRYAFDQNGVATATYPGNVVINGTETTGPLVNVGASLYPTLGTAVDTTASSANGNANITVSSAVGLAIGQGAYASFLPSFCQTAEAAYRQPYITNIVANTVTLSCNASATQSGGNVRFGQTRYDLTSSLLANYGGFKTVNIGSSAVGNTNAWLNQVSAGLDYPLTYALNVTAPVTGGGGISTAARTSDATGGFVALPFQCMFLADTWTANKGGWCGYYQSNLYAATAGQVGHIQVESSINNQWPEVDPDSYTPNPINETVNLRLDCGTGQSSALGQTRCSHFVDMINNGATTKNGITIFDGALDTSGGRIAPAIEMPQNVGFVWNSAANTLNARIYAKADPFPNLNIELPTNGSINYTVNSVPRLGLNDTQLYPVSTNQYNLGSQSLAYAGVYARYVQTVAITFATLTACNAGARGHRAMITDSNTAVFAAAAAGGGANIMPVYCDGVSWKVG